MFKIIFKAGCVTVAVGLLLASCTITKPYKRPEVATDSLYRGVSSSDTTSIALQSWREIIRDTVLQGLIEKGLQNNLDLKIAVARIQSAGAYLQESKMAMLPSLSVNPSFTLSKTSSAQLRSFNIGSDSTGSGGTSSIPTVKQYALTASTSWEADIWGKLRSNKRAYVASLLRSEAYRTAVQTQLISDIATNYYALLAYDEQLRITRNTVAIRKSDVETMTELKKSAMVTGADVVQSKANQFAAEVSVPDIKQNIRETENALSILLAIPSDSIPRTSLAEQTINSSLSTGVPAQLLAVRPDVQQAEYSFRNAFELTNAARTYFYPSLTITGSGGFATANTLSRFFAGTFYGSLVAGLTQPILSKGENKRRLRAAEATQAEAFYTYKATLLTAGQEVSNALYSFEMASEKSVSRQQQIAELEKAVSYTKELLKYSSNTNFTDVLTTEQNLLSAQLNAVNDRLQQLQAVVQLYRALGGGWR